jgi:BirA family biotin operon repressor/biotin-[acetyl-CoA-carboxylase] ligase
MNQPLDVVRLRDAVLGEVWTALDLLAETGSTNADVAALAGSGAPEGLVVVAEAQNAGRGRIGRQWISPPGAGLTFSVLFRPNEVPAARWSWLPLLAGVALARSVGRAAGVETWLKWPNDLLIGAERAKAAGLLAETVPSGVVLGIGLNVTLAREDLPRPDTTSLALAGATELDRNVLLPAILNALGEDYLAWLGAGGDPQSSGLLAAYGERCDTLGREVRVELPGADPLLGKAVDIDLDGRLAVETPTGVHSVAAGDVTHVRPA